MHISSWYINHCQGNSDVSDSNSEAENMISARALPKSKISCIPPKYMSKKGKGISTKAPMAKVGDFKMCSATVLNCVVFFQKLKERPYVPAFKSGSYALIIALYKAKEVHVNLSHKIHLITVRKTEKANCHGRGRPEYVPFSLSLLPLFPREHVSFPQMWCVGKACLCMVRI